MKAIVAVTSDWGIGKDNNLLVSIPEDMKFFRETTKGCIVIMGRKTLESFPNGAPLKNRLNIVITRDTSYEKEGAVIVHSVEDAVAYANEVLEKTDDESGSMYRDCFVIGGESIYKQALPYVDTALVTRMDVTVPADSFFPNLEEDEDFMLFYSSEEKEHEGITYRFCTYKRK